MIPGGGVFGVVAQGGAAPGGDFFGERQGLPFLLVEPADVLTRLGRLTGREIDEVDMLVSGRDIFQLHAEWRAELAGMLWERERDARLAGEAGGDPGFLPDFTDCRVVWEFVWLNVASRRQPASELGVVVEQDTVVVDDKDRHREVPGDGV